MSDKQFALWGGGVVFLCLLMILTGLSYRSQIRGLKAEVAQSVIALAACSAQPALREMLEHEREYH